MQDYLSLLTFDWFLQRAAVGFIVGYILRIYEHAAWAKRDRPEENVISWALMMLPQSILIGMTLGYVLSALAALYFKNSTAVEITTYLGTALMSFLAVDLRDLLRRIRKA